MLYCDLCNYFSSMQSKGQNKSKCVCEITGFVFHKKPEEYDMENYPCYDYEVKSNCADKEELQAIEIAEKKLA